MRDGAVQGREAGPEDGDCSLDDADEYLMMPLHIPMTAALSQTMTLAQRELRQWEIDKFIVAGVSEGEPRPC